MAKLAGASGNLDCTHCFHLGKVLDKWHARDLGTVLVNFCATLVARHTGLPSQLCDHAEICGKGMAVEHDGSVCACDHYDRLGNVAERSLGDMVFAPARLKFDCAKSETLRAC